MFRRSPASLQVYRGVVRCDAEPAAQATRAACGDHAFPMSFKLGAGLFLVAGFGFQMQFLKYQDHVNHVRATSGLGAWKREQAGEEFNPRSEERLQMLGRAPQTPGDSTYFPNRPNEPFATSFAEMIPKAPWNW